MSSSAPRRRLDVRQQTPHRSTGSRRAAIRRRKKIRPTPAIGGAFALVAAGIGSSVTSSHTDKDVLSANYQTISANYTSAGAAGAAVDVSRDFDRSLLEKQAREQVAQRAIALENLAKKTQQRADELKRNQWVLPVAGYRLSAQFGASSSMWSSGTHSGLDMSGPSGSTIVSVAAGTVKSTGYNGSWGNRTIVTLKDGTDVWYCHQSRISVSPGDKVDPGQVIGYTGSTGNVTGPHLHIEIHPGGGAAVDPIPVLQQHGVNP
ncbi:MAG TPA: M23 family metallopeptidase [Mycobacterium sp.]|nr:M23 family metallopeptidase [Mycobacterium sp.]